MARYGSDFTSGRSTWGGRNRMGAGYDVGYRGGDAWGERPSGRGRGWNEFEEHGGFGDRSRSFRGGLDESWGSMGHGGGRQDYGEGYGPSWSDFGTTGAGWGTTASRFGQNRGGYAGYGGMRRDIYDRDMRLGGRMGHDYDEDFGDRIRRGWNRFRNEARGWMGRGYDRGW